MATTDTLRSQHVPQPFFPSFAPVTIPASNVSRKRKYSSIASSTIPRAAAMVASNPPKTLFNASKHIRHAPPSKIHTMEEIGRSNEGISPNAVSEPFSLFTEEAVKQMRAEIFSKEVMENCQYSSNLSACQIRGYAAKYAPFIYDAWHSPEVLEIVSKVAGIDLVPAMDFEIGHVNVAVSTKEEQNTAIQTIRENGSSDNNDDTPVVGWHRDAYPFVCVLMLSDCKNMVGGETALRTGSGEIMKVRGPGMGHAVILQGRYIDHQALRASGGAERITMVTSFRPKSATVPDDTVLNTVRPISDLSELYGQYSEYRLDLLEEKFRMLKKLCRTRKEAEQRFDTTGVKKSLAEVRAFIDTMIVQMVDEDKVIQGFTEDTGVPSEDPIEAAKKKIKMSLGNK